MLGKYLSISEWMRRAQQNCKDSLQTPGILCVDDVCLVEHDDKTARHQNYEYPTDNIQNTPRGFY